MSNSGRVDVRLAVACPPGKGWERVAPSSQYGVGEKERAGKTIRSISNKAGIRPRYQKARGKKVGECGRIFMSDSQDMVQAKNKFYDDISEPILFFLRLSPRPEHISSGIPDIFRHLFKPDNIF